MSDWSVADAKARFSELILQVRETPQRVTKRGYGVAVVIAPEEYERLLRATERAEHHPMRAFLEAADGIRAGDDLGLSLPRRRRAHGRPDPFSGKR